MTNVQSLKALYVKLGGSLVDVYPEINDGVKVGDYVTVADMIQAVTKVAGSGGGGESKILQLHITEVEKEVYEADISGADLLQAIADEKIPVIMEDGVYPICPIHKVTDTYVYFAFLYIDENDYNDLSEFWRFGYVYDKVNDTWDTWNDYWPLLPNKDEASTGSVPTLNNEHNIEWVAPQRSVVSVPAQWDDVSTVYVLEATFNDIIGFAANGQSVVVLGYHGDYPNPGDTTYTPIALESITVGNECFISLENSWSASATAEHMDDVVRISRV